MKFRRQESGGKDRHRKIYRTLNKSDIRGKQNEAAKMGR